MVYKIEELVKKVAKEVDPDIADMYLSPVDDEGHGLWYYTHNPVLEMINLQLIRNIRHER